MSEAEKKVQIADAVTDYQAAKIEVAHQEEKLKRVLAAYAAVASAEGFFVKDDHLQILEAARFSRADLLNEQELKALIEQRQHAHVTLDAAKKTMNRLGIDLI